MVAATLTIVVAIIGALITRGASKFRVDVADSARRLRPMELLAGVGRRAARSS